MARIRRRGAKPRDSAPRARRAALLYMQGGMTLADVAERFGISASSVHDALLRIRQEQRRVWPEDEVTL